MTGIIVGLTATSQTGVVRSQEGLRFVFAAASVLGDFDTLAVGQIVNFDLDRAGQHEVAIRVFREPVGVSRIRTAAEPREDLRFIGFTQTAGVRRYLFDTATRGHEVRHFGVKVDLGLMLKHNIGVQDAPALCLRKLSEDLKKTSGAEPHELSEQDLQDFASSRAAAQARKAPKHTFAGRRGSRAPGVAGDQV